MSEARLMWVLEFQGKDGEWEWFWGYATAAEARADKKRYGKERLADRMRLARVTKWRKVSQ